MTNIHLGNYTRCLRRPDHCGCSEAVCDRCTPRRSEAEVVQLRSARVELPADCEPSGSDAA